MKPILQTIYVLLFPFVVLYTKAHKPLAAFLLYRQLFERVTMSSAIQNSDNTLSTKSTTLGTSLVSSHRVKQTLDPCVVLMQELVGEHRELWKDKGGIFSLAQGVVYWKPPETVHAALKDALQNDNDHTLHLYGPDEGLIDLRQALQEKIQTENGLTEHHHIIITSGANQAYMNCVLTLLDAKDHAVVFAPYYFNHVMALQLSLSENNIRIGTTTNQGKPNVEWLRKQFQKQKQVHSIRMVTITNPNNPLGVTLTRDDLQPIVELCAENKAWLVLDCTYEYFVPDTLPCFPDAPNVVYIFSFSKSYALAGYRIGYVVVPSVDLYQQMIKVQDTIPICPSRISQVAALGALQAGKSWVLEQYETLTSGREAIFDALKGCVQIIGGQGAMYVMAQLPMRMDDPVTDDVEFARCLVRDFGVAVIPGTFCGAPGWIRVCYANLPPMECQRAAGRLAAGLKALMEGDIKSNI